MLTFVGMRGLINFCLFFLVLSIGESSFSQYYDTSAMRVIHQNRSANEGDLYMDTVNDVYRIGMTNGRLGYIMSPNSLDSAVLIQDSLLVLYFSDSSRDTANLSGINKETWKIKGNSGTNSTTDFIGTTDAQDLVFRTKNVEKLRIDTLGDIRFNLYPETRADDTTTYLNLLYTDDQGTVKSARREVIPPTAYINATTVTPGNSFNFYNYYSAQLSGMGLTPIPLANLDFYIFSYDPAVFNNVTISSTGVLTYDVIATSDTKTYIDVRFYTK